MSRFLVPLTVIAQCFAIPSHFVLLYAVENQAVPASSNTAEQPALTTSNSASAEDRDGELNVPLAGVPLAGHSEHGEAYNDGPRQDAYLMGGTGRVDLKVTTSHEQAQAYFNQGLGQIYGFWYYEAERTFRQVVALDSTCAMGYWGLAQANIDNKERSAEFIKEAYEKREGAGEHEQMYIDASYSYLTNEGTEKELRRGYVKGLEKIIRKYPEDVEAKAMLAVHLWQSDKHGLPIVSHHAVDSILEQVFQEVPNHPAHHFRIHLWDHEEPSQALASAAVCGQSAPAIAHMWHMPGHIFSRLHRFHDAIFQQEASARADHAHMMRDGVLPDQIHNYAHNNEWLIRNLINVGRARDAIRLAKNMLDLPRHPKYNSYSKKGMCSCKYGRARLLQIYETYEMWDELVKSSQSVYYPATKERELQIPRLRALGVAHYRRGESEKLVACIQQLSALADAIRNDAELAADKAEQKLREQWSELEQDSTVGEQDELENKAESQIRETEESSAEAGIEDVVPVAESRKPDQEERSQRIKQARTQAVDRVSKGSQAIERAIAELKGLQLLARGETDQAIQHFGKAAGSKAKLAEYYFLCGEHAKSVKLLQQSVEAGKKEVYPLAKQVDLLRRMGKTKAAQGAFEKLRVVAGNADLRTPLLVRLKKIAAELDYPSDWRRPLELRDDVGERPDLNTLGPLRWASSPASSWSLTDNTGATLSLSDYRGQPLVVIFYLGGECLHCVEQLHKFAPLQKAFESAGISLVGIAAESKQKLQSSLDNYETLEDFPFPLFANENLSVFKAYRVFDDFENLPLHGTFLIDGEGLIRWRDVSYQPFLDVEFLLEECQRLLAINGKSND